MPDTYLSNEELTQPRTPEELSLWMKDKLQEIAEKSPRGKETIYSPATLLEKKFIEEMYPLSIFAKYKYQNHPNVLLNLETDTNKAYDASITELTVDGNVTTRLEITQAINEDDYWRKLVRRRDGIVSGNGKVNKSGTKNTGIELSVDPPEDASYESHINSVLERLHHAIQNKNKPRYDSTTSLLVFYDDNIIFRDNNVEAILDVFFEKKILPLKLTFKELYLVGMSKQTYHEYEIFKSS